MQPSCMVADDERRILKMCQNGHAYFKIRLMF